MNLRTLILLLLIFLFTSKYTFAQPNDDSVYLFADRMPAFPGGNDSLFAFLAAHTKYPQSAIDSDKDGRVFISMLIKKDGRIEHPVVYKSVWPALDSEALRVVSVMPPWIPGEAKGKTVNVRHVLPVTFKLEEQVHIFSFVEEMPSPTFNMQTFLAENLRYPNDAREEGIEGRVVVKFTIDESGNVINPIIVASPDTLLSAEALRIARLMPKWKPGTQSGKPLKVFFNLPIVFKIENPMPTRYRRR